MNVKKKGDATWKTRSTPFATASLYAPSSCISGTMAQFSWLAYLLCFLSHASALLWLRTHPRTAMQQRSRSGELGNPRQQTCGAKRRTAVASLKQLKRDRRAEKARDASHESKLCHRRCLCEQVASAVRVGVKVASRPTSVVTTSRGMQTENASVRI